MKQLTRIGKEKKVEELIKDFNEAKSLIFTQFSGLTVQDMENIRRRLNQKNIKFKVVKNRLVKLATRQIPGIEKFLVGPTAIALDKETETNAASLIYEFEKKKIGISVKGGILQGKLIEYEDVKRLATAPKKEIVIGQLLQLLNFQLYKLSMLLNTPLSNLSFLIDKICESKKK